MLCSVLHCIRIGGQDKGSRPTFGVPLPVLPCGAVLIRLRLNAKKGRTPMKKEIVLSVTLCLLLAPAVSGAEAPLPPEATKSVPAGLVEAITRQESSLNPWAVNVAGRDFQPSSRQEAEHIIAEAERAGVSYDVGLMQINRWWTRRYGIPPASLLNPDINKKWGTWILAQEIARHGYNWRAVGKYHSPDAERGRRYAWRVYRHYTARPEPGSPASKERFHAEQKTSAQNLSDAGGIQRLTGQRPQGRIITFDIQQTGMSWLFRAKSGTPGSPAGTSAFEK